jgi:hypothetical protein
VTCTCLLTGVGGDVDGFVGTFKFIVEIQVARLDFLTCHKKQINVVS